MIRAVAMCFLFVWILTPVVTWAADVAEIGVGTSVENRTLLEPGSEFSISDGRVFCLTRVTGAAGTTVQHVWKRNGEEVAVVSLSVGSDNWRTWSSKLLIPGMEGDWSVSVLDSQGKRLGETEFRVRP